MGLDNGNEFTGMLFIGWQQAAAHAARGAAFQAGFYMDRHTGPRILRLDIPFDFIRNPMRFVHGHMAIDQEMDVHEPDMTGAAGPQIVKSANSGGKFTDTIMDPRLLFGWNHSVQEITDRILGEHGCGFQDEQGHDNGCDGINPVKMDAGK